MTILLRLDETKFLVIDTETTGVQPETDRVVEVAAVAVKGNRLKVAFHSLIDPLMPIPPEASGVHGIADWHVEGKPTFETIWPNLQALIDRADVLVAHNAPFDRAFLPPIDKPWLDTLRLARHLWPKAPNHQNQTLRYYCKLRLEGLAHSADGDALVTAHLLILLLRTYTKLGLSETLADLLTFSESPIMVKKMPFGKHAGTALEDLPPDYVEWLLREGRDLDRDLRHSLQTLFCS